LEIEWLLGSPGRYPRLARADLADSALAPFAT
jgi:hypothetical protein